MALYIDSAYLEEVVAVAQTVPVVGVTTNPTLLLDAYQRGQRLDKQQVLQELLEHVEGTIFMQISLANEEQAYQEALTYIQKNPERVQPKIPLTSVGIRVAQRLKKQGHGIAFTAVTTVAQAYVGAMVGADFLIPYYNRLRRSGVDPVERVAQMAKLLHTQNLPTRILAASIKTPNEAAEALYAGAHDLTVPPKVLLDMVNTPETEQAVEKFEQDNKKLR